MLAQVDYVFAEAEIDYRHEQLMAQVRQHPNPRRPVIVTVRDAWRGLRRRPALRQPVPAPHHLTAA